MNSFNNQHGKNKIYRSSVEHVIRMTGKGVTLKLVGTKWGMSYSDINREIRRDLLDRTYSTPRCSRLRAWDTERRLREIEELAK